MQDYKAKRAEQKEEPKVTGGFQKRIHKLTKEKAEAEERAAAAERRAQELEANRNGNGNGAGPQEQSRNSESYEPSPQNSDAAADDAEDPKITEMRRRFPDDYDEVRARAVREQMRIPDEAFAAMKSLPNADIIEYELAKNDALRAEINKSPVSRQVQVIRQLGAEIASQASGIPSLEEKMAATFSGEEETEILQALKENEFAKRIGREFTHELLDVPNGPQIFRYLILDRDAAERFLSKGRKAAVWELGRLSAKLDRRPVSKAPTPIRPVSGGSSRSSVPLDQLDDMAEYKRRRAAGEK